MTHRPAAPLSARVLRVLLRLARHPMGLVHALVLGAALVGTLVHQAWFWDWFIEDAAISFAYARNLAWGEGLVPFPGGERVEGYSNPTWVALLALGELVGVDGFSSSKVFQLVLAGLTVPLVYRLTALLAPRRGEGEPLVAVGFLATSTTWAIWGASGLENALFSFLLAAALLRSVLDLRRATFPWAAFLWFLLAITRPEAILYCAVAGALTMAFTLHRGLRPTLLWLGGFFVPFGVYHAVRFGYFAYEFPQTYYGKMTTKNPAPLSWDRRGWKYVREWSHTLHVGYYAPLLAGALAGLRGWRGGLALGSTLLLGLWILLPDRLPEQSFLVGSFEIDVLLKPHHLPAWWGTGRAHLVALWAMAMALLGLGDRPGWQGRTLVAGVGASIVFFAIYTMGDWMKAWRWMSLPTVPLAVLFGLGVGALVDRVEDAVDAVERRVPTGWTARAGWALVQFAATGLAFAFGSAYAFGRLPLVGIVLGGMLLALVLGGVGSITARRWTVLGHAVAALAVIATLLPNMAHLRAQRRHPETAPEAIQKRVDYVRDVAAKLDLQHRIVDLDVDMGAHLWWGRDDFHMLDLAGLIDVPFAQHRFQHAFVEEYVFREMRPDIAHVHGGWASQSRMAKHASWRQDYIEIPGYPAGGRTLHPGTFVRRQLFLKRKVGTREDRRTTFADGWVLEDLDIPAVVPIGGTAWLQLAVRAEQRPSALGLPRVLVSLSQQGELVEVREVPLVWDWFGAETWRKGEVFQAGFPVALPRLRPGRYDVGLALVGPDGQFLAVEAAPEGAVTTPPVFATGEVRFPGMLHVVSHAERDRSSAAELEHAFRRAREGACNSSRRAWDRARWHHVGDEDWWATNRPVIGAALADCWTRWAEKTPDQVVPSLLKAARWDDDQPRYLAVRRMAGQTLYERGLKAFAKEEWPRAYKLLRDAVRVDPTRSWARRYAEQARSRRWRDD